LWRARGSERSKLRGNTAKAFAPAAISNFFAIHDEAVNPRDYSSFARAGATGGGFILSRGVHTAATFVRGPSRRVEITVNGVKNYPARTTRRAVELLFNEGRERAGTGSLLLEQQVEVPIGQGFGASAASALSAVLAAAAVVGIEEPVTRVAYPAHVADIVSQTGLGTVSAIFERVGAGAITIPGAPGIAQFVQVKIPRGLKVVTASLAPFAKSKLLDSAVLRRRANRLGEIALGRVIRTPTMGELARSGEWFADVLGLESPELKALIKIARKEEALWASQNMIGYSIHCVVKEGHVTKVVNGLSKSSLHPDVRTFDFGREKSRVLD